MWAIGVKFNLELEIMLATNQGLGDRVGRIDRLLGTTVGFRARASSASSRSKTGVKAGSRATRCATFKRAASSRSRDTLCPELGGIDLGIVIVLHEPFLDGGSGITPAAGVIALSRLRSLSGRF